jgi:hypothetical protein
MSKNSIKIVLGILAASLVVLAIVVVGPGTVAQNTNSSTTMSDSGTGQDDNTEGGVQESLAGTYVGRVTMTGSHEMSGPARLTLSGSTFRLELTDGGMSHEGRLFAVRTRGYTGAALYFTDMNDPRTNTPVAASVRIRQRGNSITVTPVPGAHNRLSFTGRSE